MLLMETRIKRLAGRLEHLAASTCSTSTTSTTAFSSSSSSSPRPCRAPNTLSVIDRLRVLRTKLERGASSVDGDAAAGDTAVGDGAAAAAGIFGIVLLLRSQLRLSVGGKGFDVYLLLLLLLLLLL